MLGGCVGIRWGVAGCAGLCEGGCVATQCGAMRPSVLRYDALCWYVKAMRCTAMRCDALRCDVCAVRCHAMLRGAMRGKTTHSGAVKRGGAMLCDTLR